MDIAIKIKIALAAFACISLPTRLMANDGTAHDHGDPLFHAFRLETDLGRSHGKDIASWDTDGWLGDDINKLWLKAKGETAGSTADKNEFWALYSRNVSPFWDAQIGMRQDFSPQNHSALALGFIGLAPYFFETEAHLFYGDDGDLGARLRQENDILLSNRLISKPYIEANLSSKTIAALRTGTGLVDMQIGIQTRYELTKGFAPYVDMKFQKRFAQTATFALQNNEPAQTATMTFGIRWFF